MGIETKRRAGATGTSSTTLPGGLVQEQDVASTGVEKGFKSGSLKELRSRGVLGKKKATEKSTEKEVVDPYAGLSPKERRAAAKQAKQIQGGFSEYPHLVAIKPREKYLFRSDYFQVDDRYAAILGFFHDEASRDEFTPFWGIDRIPSGLDEGVTVVVTEQVRRMSQKWIDENMKSSERLDKLDGSEQETSGSMSSRRKAAKVTDDLMLVSGEIQDGAAYLHVHNRMLVKAPSLELLDKNIEHIGRQYIDRFVTLKLAAYAGEQRPELSAVFRKNEKKRGKGFYFTSTELAGSHSLVTNGLNDPAGEYVGYMVGDVNNSAVLFDVNRYDHHVVVANGTINTVLDRAYYSDLWGSKLSQAALLDNGRVVHLVLDGANLDKLGPRFDGFTSRLDMNAGDINMFQMFGAVEDELAIFPSHLEKLVLMVEQAYETTESDRSIIRGSLKEILTTFYVDKAMWYRNAKDNRSRLRVVNIPHDQVPRLQDIVSYFDTAYLSQARSSAKDQKLLNAYSTLRLVFKDLLDNSGDLFNTHTKDAIDGVALANRVLYDFSKLMNRSKGVAMAQLVNTVGFAVSNLGLGDTVIIHGTENIDAKVKEYITTQFERLFARGGRVAYLYNDVDKMLADSTFNKFDDADYTLLGPMRDSTVVEYQKQLHQDIPTDLQRLVTTKGENLTYLRRDHTNVVFKTVLALGINPAREGRRQEIEEILGHTAAQPEQVQLVASARNERRETMTKASSAQAALGVKPAKAPRRSLGAVAGQRPVNPGGKRPITRDR